MVNSIFRLKNPDWCVALKGLIRDYIYKETAPTTFSVGLEVKNFYIVKRSTKQPRRLVERDFATGSSYYH